MGSGCQPVWSAIIADQTGPIDLLKIKYLLSFVTIILVYEKRSTAEHLFPLRRRLRPYLAALAQLVLRMWTSHVFQGLTFLSLSRYVNILQYKIKVIFMWCIFQRTVPGGCELVQKGQLPSGATAHAASVSHDPHTLQAHSRYRTTNEKYLYITTIC